MKLFFLAPFFFVLFIDNSVAQHTETAKLKTCGSRTQTDVLMPFGYDGELAYNDDDKKRVRGEFKNGRKFGTWSYFDENGKLIEKRKYTSNYAFTSPAKTGISSEPLARNESGNIPFHFIKEEDVAWSARFYQMVEFEKITEFDGKLVKQALENILIDPTVIKYADNNLKNEIPYDVTQLNNYALVGFLTKNEIWVDKKRMITDERIISFQFLAKNVQTGQLETLPALYYPHVREKLAKTPIEYSDYVTNLDDVFYHHLFRGPVNQVRANDKVVYNDSQVFSDENCYFYADYTTIFLEAETFLSSLLKK